MTVPGGQINMTDIANEWGGGYSLSQYYKGGSYVPSGHVGAPNVPSSGQISFSNFANSTAELDQYTITNHWWSYRDRYTRAWASSGWAGDTNQWNNPNARYVSSVTNTFSYANSDLGKYSKYFTMVYMSVGGLGDYGSMSGSVNSGSLYATNRDVFYLGDGASPAVTGTYGLAYKVQVYSGYPTDVTSSTVTSTHGGGNYGVWTYSYMIPGRWAVAEEVYNPNFASFSRTMSPGRIHMVFIERGGNGSGYVASAHSTTSTTPNPYQINYNAWWYNGGAVQLNCNPTGSNIDNAWWALDSYGNKTSPWPMTETPRVFVDLYRY